MKILKLQQKYLDTGESFFKQKLFYFLEAFKS